jgi:rhodanese-related sulfurtransferase
MKNIIKLIGLLLIASPSFAQHKIVLTPGQFETAISSGDVVVIDVRRPDEFSKGHIKGAVNANWQDLAEFSKKTELLEKSRPVYIYCQAGVRSEKASEWMRKNGFKHVSGLDGGIQAWKNLGKPVE